MEDQGRSKLDFSMDWLSHQVLQFEATSPSDDRQNRGSLQAIIEIPEDDASSEGGVGTPQHEASSTEQLYNIRSAGRRTATPTPPRQRRWMRRRPREATFKALIPPGAPAPQQGPCWGCMKFGHLVGQCPDGPWSPEVTKKNAAKWRETMRGNAKVNLANASEEEQQAEFHAISEFIASGFEDDHALNTLATTEETSPPPVDFPEATETVAEEDDED